MDDEKKESAEHEKREFLAEARRRAKYAREAWEYNYEEMDDDIRMLNGDQWPEQVKKEREADGRPALKFNRLNPIIDQIVGDQRQARQAINITPAQGDIEGTNAKIKNYAGTKDFSLAEVYEGIIRNIEYSSNAETAYDTAFEHCASWGLGFIRILTDYTDERSFDQDFCIERVRNYKSVLVDPDFEKADGSDIGYGFVFSKIPIEEFENTYPDKLTTSVDIDTDQIAIWNDGEFVYIAEYYYLKDHEFTIYQLNDGRIVDADEFDSVADELAAVGITKVKERKVQSKKCYYCKINGADIIEEEQEVVFRWVPLIPVLGKELVVDGTPKWRGAIRFSKDAQVMYNYSRTADIERTALVPKVPYIVSDKQIRGYEDKWDRANDGNVTYLPYKETNAPPPMRQPPVSTNPGETQQSMLASDDIQSTSGIYNASLGARSNETSGTAIRARQMEGDVGNYAFADNLSRSIRHVGRILIDAIPKVYDTQRVIRVRFPDDTEDNIQINQIVRDEETGQMIKVNDLSVGKFDIIVKAGASYSTQRVEALDNLSQILQAAPQLWNIIGDLLAKNMDWPGADEFAKRLKKMIPPEILDDDSEMTPQQLMQIQQQMQAQQIQAQIAQGAQQADMARSQAAQAKAQADIIKTQSTIAQAEADQIDAQAKILEVTEKMANLESNLQNLIIQGVMQVLTQMQDQQMQPQYQQQAPVNTMEQPGAFNQPPPQI